LSDTRTLIWTIALTNIPFLVAIAVIAPPTIPALLAFIFFGAFYSAPPIRAKAIPFLDGMFNILYVMPALVAILIFPYAQINWVLVLAGTLWCMAMHAFSAIPDIEVDASANLNTVATVLKRKGASFYCTLLWTLSALLALFAPNPLPVILVLVSLFTYLLLLWTSLREKSLFAVYRAFPYINTLVGACIALYLLGFIFQGPALYF
jgi:4-hydroxybenzoate polyprenyltransferase